jgi:hypothetical protein
MLLFYTSGNEIIFFPFMSVKFASVNSAVGSSFYSTDSNVITGEEVFYT